MQMFRQGRREYIMISPKEKCSFWRPTWFQWRSLFSHSVGVHCEKLTAYLQGMQTLLCHVILLFYNSFKEKEFWAKKPSLIGFIHIKFWKLYFVKYFLKWIVGLVVLAIIFTTLQKKCWCKIFPFGMMEKKKEKNENSVLN